MGVEEDELHDGYWYNGETVSSPPTPPVESLYRWVKLNGGSWGYMQLSNGEIVCIVSSFDGYHAHYPIMKTYESVNAAWRAVEEHFGR